MDHPVLVHPTAGIHPPSLLRTAVCLLSRGWCFSLQASQSPHPPSPPSSPTLSFYVHQLIPLAVRSASWTFICLSALRQETPFQLMFFPRGEPQEVNRKRKGRPRGKFPSQTPVRRTARPATPSASTHPPCPSTSSAFSPTKACLEKTAYPTFRTNAFAFWVVPREHPKAFKTPDSLSEHVVFGLWAQQG